MHFFGIDLAFSQDNPSGLFVIDGNGEFIGKGCAHSNQDIGAFIAHHAHPDGSIIVADAPLICTNESGQRPCEKRVGQLYGKYDASCHSSNTRNKAGQRGPKLVDELSDTLPVFIQQDARNVAPDLWPVIETYPHPAHVELFQLQRILKYKKGTVKEKRHGLARYTTKLKELENREPALQPRSISLLDADVDQLKGHALKQHEDLLDALFCAYTAFHLWHHRDDESRWRVIKQHESLDFITIPLP